LLFAVRQVGEDDLRVTPVRVSTDLMESRQLGLVLKLRPRHFTKGSPQGRIQIRCDARIFPMYCEEAKLLLRPRYEVPSLARDVPVSSAAAVEPKPERGERPQSASYLHEKC
jgi:hypothetical protein